MEPERSALVSSVSFWTATTLEGSGPMSDDTSMDETSLKKLEAIVDDQLKGASPEIKRTAAEVGGAPLDGGLNAHPSGEDVLQEHTDMASDAQMEQLDDALVENWIRSREGVTEKRKPQRHSVEAPRDSNAGHGLS